MSRSLQLIAAALVAALGLGGAAVAIAPVAAGHSQLVSSDPRDGAELAAAPAYVRLVFNEDLLGDTAAVVATTSSGVTLPLDDPRVDGPAVEVAWPESGVGNTFVVSYRVVSADGHPITGSITFSVADVPEPSPSPTPTTATPTPTSASPTPTTATPTPTPAPTTSAGPSPTTGSATPAPVPAGNTGIAWGWVIGLGALGLLVIAAVAAALVGRRR